MSRVIFNGNAGEAWTNDGPRVRYQLLVDWHNSCGLCCQYDHAIGPIWPTPFHRGCRCKQRPIWPGDSALPFVDFRQKIAELDHVQQSRVIGRANWNLIESGTLKWDDVVTSNRVRTLREVVSREKLTVDAMVAAGVQRGQAERAFEAVHTPAHQLVEEARRAALKHLADLGVGKAEVREHFGTAMAGRVTIAAGPSFGPERGRPVPRGPKPPLKPLTPAAVAAVLNVRLKPETPKAPARVLGESTRAEYEDLRAKVASLPDFGPERRQHVLEWVRERTGPDTASHREHGMTDAENLHHLRVDDIVYHFPPLPEPASAGRLKMIADLGEQIDRLVKAGNSQRKRLSNQIMRIAEKAERTPEDQAKLRTLTDKLAKLNENPDLTLARNERTRLINLNVDHPFVKTLAQLAEKPEWPAAIQGVTKEVYFSKQANNKDDYWKVQHKDPDFVSAATGGDSNVVVYHGRGMSTGTFVHETGHNFATVKSRQRGDYFTGTDPGPDFHKAMATGEKPVSNYASKNPAEDFAESMRLYVERPKEMESIAPMRYNVIKKLMEDPDYGG